MGFVSPELSLDLRPSYVNETIDGFLKDVSMMGDLGERLEDEMKKVKVFKRELPLCMHLLERAIQVLKQNSTQQNAINDNEPVLEEFIPLKKETYGENKQITDDIDGNKGDGEECSRDKKNWMSSVQLWNADNCTSSTSNPLNSNQNQSQTPVSDSRKGDDKGKTFGCNNSYDAINSRGGSKVFVPMIHTYPSFPEFKRKVDKDVSVPGLSLLLPGVKIPKPDSKPGRLNSNMGVSRTSCTVSPVSNGQSVIRHGHQQPNARKQRRCWSPELHRRFIDALTQLGGPQVATPKQIRELMQVDGLTNDEVKSHLQKYRLHARRTPNVPATSKNDNCNALSSSWATLDQNSDVYNPSHSQSGSPQGPLQFPGTIGGDSMEDEDDDKSEGYSWKGHVQRPVKEEV